MKKWGFLLFLIVCLGYIAYNKAQFFQDKIEIQYYELNEYNNIETSESISSKEIEKDQVYQGNLLLVNNDYPLRKEGVKSDIVHLFEHKDLTKGYGLLDTEIYLSEHVAREFAELVSAAKNDGVWNFTINSGYRNFEEQSILYQEMGADYALPAGYSEHNLGLSLDVGSTLMKMDDAPEGKWIEENAWEYGFVLRYPKDKTDITGIQYEPWHIRYVGLPHSAIMKEKNFALEEYLDYLREQKKLSVGIGGKTYTISYYNITDKVKIETPEDRIVEISGNNVDGVIVTELLS